MFGGTCFGAALCRELALPMRAEPFEPSLPAPLLEPVTKTLWLSAAFPIPSSNKPDFRCGFSRRRCFGVVAAGSATHGLDDPRTAFGFGEQQFTITLHLWAELNDIGSPHTDC
jgi:hypothetical protein